MEKNRRPACLAVGESFFMWLMIAGAVGSLLGCVGAVFHHAVDLSDALRRAHPWILFTLPLAGAAIASAIAAFASIPRFEKGGIVGGNSPEGDKILARLNSGEMVLNKDQQGTLYGLLNNRKQQVSVSGEFRVRGRDLMAVIDSNNRFIERTK